METPSEAFKNLERELAHRIIVGLLVEGESGKNVDEEVIAKLTREGIDRERGEQYVRDFSGPTPTSLRADK